MKEMQAEEELKDFIKKRMGELYVDLKFLEETIHQFQDKNKIISNPDDKLTLNVSGTTFEVNRFLLTSVKDSRLA